MFDKRDEATSKKGARTSSLLSSQLWERVPISDRQEVAQIIALMVARRMLPLSKEASDES